MNFTQGKNKYWMKRSLHRLTKFKVFLSKTSLSQLNSLDQKLKTRIITGIKNLENGPYSSRSGANIKKLVSQRDPPLYRLRIGDYRIIYFVIEKNVKITDIIPRKKGYKWLD